MNNEFKSKVRAALDKWRWRCDAEEGMLMLLELMVKVQNGYYISHTESGFLSEMNVMTKSKTPNSMGKSFMCYMIYASSNNRPPSFDMMREYRD
ncbi:MAG: hypothetical protein AAGK05_17995 [Pseudomonadota bacterium]